MVIETFGPQPRLSSGPEMVTYLNKTLSCQKYFFTFILPSV